MAKEICISSTPHETRLAILEDDQLAEIYYERENEYTLAGSIYNGRVTRVLPGMQSAFVDVGLERDAFLYVTDFLELEDAEETDELEKAAASGGAQAPREIRHTNGQQGRGEDRGARPRQDQRQEQRQDRPPQDRSQERAGREQRPAHFAGAEPVDAERAVGEQPTHAEYQERVPDETGDGGARRWRGRRRRRGGRSQPGSQGAPVETESSLEIELEPAADEDAAPAIQATAPAPAPRGSQPPTAPRFVLPGESLSKYGGASADEAPKPAAESAGPARPASTFKPSTLIEAPLAWDGSGLLPGESLSKHRARQPELAVEAEPASQQFAGSTDALEEDFVEETTETGPAGDAKPAFEAIVEETLPTGDEDDSVETVFEAPSPHPEPNSGHEPVAHAEAEHREATSPMLADMPADIESAATESAELAAFSALAATFRHQDAPEPPAHEAKPAVPAEAGEPEPDASASHHVDPSHPAGFRLFGLGGKKKRPEDPVVEAPQPVAAPAPKPAEPVTVSAYAPGSGLIEEEVIEGPEFDATPHHHPHKGEEHDLDDFEEETLQTQIRSGELGEMLQEAHLDHRIQLNFDDKNGDEEGEDAFDEDEDEEEEPAAEAEAHPGTGESQGPGQQRRDRGGRGRRGRGAPGGQGRPGDRGRGQSRRSAQTSDLPIISDLLKPGQEILVQIAKEPIAKKGARITSHIALPGRFLVFMPTVGHIGVSRKIASDEERQRLKRILISERGEASGGFIVRTAAEGASEEELRADLRFLLHLWAEIKQRSESSKSPALIYHDLSLIERILRDQVSSNFSSIWVDSEADYERIVRFLNRFSPNLVRRVKLYTKEIPLFEHFGIQDEISKALRSKVWLKSGGSIVINQTEALVAIDINTGKYVGKSARLEDTILKTNLDAVPEIVRQIRLRDLGGIIVIDFIDMDERKNRFKVMAALEEALKSDRAPTKVLQFNDFGLVAITRKRVKQSLERTLSVPCPTCQATGMVKSPTTVCNEIYTELRKMKKHFEGADVLLRVNPETVKVLKQNNASWLVEFEELVGKNILVKSDATLHPEQFDIQG
jgi:ribonuclease G